MRFKYSTTDPSQNEFDSLPRLPLILRKGDQIIEVLGLVDSGATINVLPYEIGLQLGGIWDSRKAIIQLAGNLSQAAMPFFATAEIGKFPSVNLAFAWVNKPNAPLILGQTNFFMEFDVSFYRSKLEFEIKPKS
ncbi:hypothetical protein PN497_24610 [Sphaerospermopsis kisseleviana CS-549]|uniref:Peptidase A2 domain-containing protein n=1 Tax=Sphaerospermopsis kisseleviana CS-549 TaxID=3021783 RepID=A0ABT4ZYK7_9CYAN|nr:hypothetical protein [Sphaerospermopsis kisseleviana]MDB9444508.1 hypothetical protein [Sphaerospermopsis kisseleviana CS-549]BAZ82919.1 hypothetical protein NIES73_42020 [Sphaerospermopsis kisseleviana NIES-73]